MFPNASAFLFVRVAHEIDEGKGDLALLEVLAQGFAELFLVRRIVEGVIGYLERKAQFLSVGRQGVLLRERRLADDGAQPA